MDDLSRPAARRARNAGSNMGIISRKTSKMKQATVMGKYQPKERREVMISTPEKAEFRTSNIKQKQGLPHTCPLALSG